MEYYAKGKRSKVYKEDEKIIKVTNEYSAKNEACWLKKLNKHKIGPKYIDSTKVSVTMEFIDGVRIIDYLDESSKIKCEKIIKDCLKQCEILDKLKVNKKEFTNPYKHIIVRNDKAVFIDFERCKLTERVKNVNQFKAFLESKRIKEIFEKKKINYSFY